MFWSKIPVSFEVLLTLDRMNRALRAYKQAVHEDERRVADVSFADCYDWLVAHGVLIYYDPKPGLWLRVVNAREMKKL